MERYRARFVSDGARHAVGALAALALVGGLGAGVIAFQGHGSRMPEVVLGCVAVFVVFGAGAWWAQARAARTLIITAGETTTLRLEGPGGAELTLEAPFDVAAAWELGSAATGRGGNISYPVLSLVVRRDGRPLLLLEESLGALHQPPASWRRGSVDATGARRLVNSLGRVHLERLRSVLLAAS